MMQRLIRALKQWWCIHIHCEGLENEKGWRCLGCGYEWRPPDDMRRAQELKDAVDEVIDKRAAELIHAKVRILELRTTIGSVGNRLRYLASSVDPKELEHELHALARECEAAKK